MSKKRSRAAVAAAAAAALPGDLAVEADETLAESRAPKMRLKLNYADLLRSTGEAVSASGEHSAEKTNAMTLAKNSPDIEAELSMASLGLTPTQYKRLQNFPRVSLSDRRGDAKLVWRNDPKARERLGAILALLTATDEPPGSWPRVAHVEYEPALDAEIGIGFSLDGHIRSTTIDMTAGKSTKTLYGRMYGHFLSDRTTPYASAARFSGRCSTAATPFNPHNFAYLRQRIADASRIAHEHIERLNLIDYDGSLLLDGLLIDPCAFYVDAFGRLYFVPFLAHAPSQGGFVPESALGLLEPKKRMRFAILFSLCRYAHGLMFARALEDDFPVDAPKTATETATNSATAGAKFATFDAWCSAVVRSEHFPSYTVYGRETPAAFVNWLMLCMSNRIETRDICQHPFFTCRTVEDLREVGDSFNHLTATLMDRFQSLWRPYMRMDDQPCTVVVIQNPGLSAQSVDHLGFRKFDSESRKIIDFSVGVMTCLNGALKQHNNAVEWTLGFNLHFRYSDMKAHGTGVSREIVFRAIEGLKHSRIFSYDAQTDVLEFSDGIESLPTRSAVIFLLRALLALIYWCVVNLQPFPCLLGPRLLEHLFSLNSQKTVTGALDRWLVTRPTSSHAVLNMLDDRAHLSALVGDNDDNDNGSLTSLSVLRDYAVEAETCARTQAFMAHIGPFDPEHFWLQQFRAVVRHVFNEPNSLVFTISRRLYGGDSAHRIAITRNVVINSFKMSNVEMRVPSDMDRQSDSEPRQYVVPTIDYTMPCNERLLLHYLVFHQRCIDDSGENGAVERSESLLARRLLIAAMWQTYVYLVRWVLCEANEEQLATLWNNLHGSRTTLNYTSSRLLGATNAANDALNAEASRLCLAACPDGEPGERNRAHLLASNAAQRQAVVRAVTPRHGKSREPILIDFRPPLCESKLLLAPQFASCASMLSLSICHENYASFATAMNGALVSTGPSFTTNA